MRFIFGAIVGAALLVAAAYAHDTMMINKQVATGETMPKPFVNWDQLTIAFGR